MIPYEILIRGNLDGTFAGAHAVDYINGVPGAPRPISAADFPSLAQDVNAAVLEKLISAEGELKQAKAETAAVQAQLDESRAIYAKAKEALQAGDVSRLKAIHAEVEKPAVQREIDALTAQLATLQKKQADLDGAQIEDGTEK